MFDSIFTAIFFYYSWLPLMQSSRRQKKRAKRTLNNGGSAKMARLLAIKLNWNDSILEKRSATAVCFFYSESCHWKQVLWVRAGALSASTSLSKKCSVRITAASASDVLSCCNSSQLKLFLLTLWWLCLSSLTESANTWPVNVTHTLDSGRGPVWSEKHKVLPWS